MNYGVAVTIWMKRWIIQLFFLKKKRIRKEGIVRNGPYLSSLGYDVGRTRRLIKTQSPRGGA